MDRSTNFIYMLSFNKRHVRLNNNKTYISAEWNEYSNAMRMWGGNELSWKRLRIMGGGSFSKKTHSISGGLGLQFGNYNISYAIRYGSQDLGIPHSISLRLLFP